MSGKICGTESRGRQRPKYTDNLNNFVTRKESPNNELIRRTDDREDWKTMITDVCMMMMMMMMMMMVVVVMILDVCTLTIMHNTDYSKQVK